MSALDAGAWRLGSFAAVRCGVYRADRARGVV